LQRRIVEVYLVHLIIDRRTTLCISSLIEELGCYLVLTIGA
jgi:hypothetical protein